METWLNAYPAYGPHHRLLLLFWRQSKYCAAPPPSRTISILCLNRRNLELCCDCDRQLFSATCVDPSQNLRFKPECRRYPGPDCPLPFWDNRRQTSGNYSIISQNKLYVCANIYITSRKFGGHRYSCLTTPNFLGNMSAVPPGSMPQRGDLLVWLSNSEALSKFICRPACEETRSNYNSLITGQTV